MPGRAATSCQLAREPDLSAVRVDLVPPSPEGRSPGLPQVQVDPLGRETMICENCGCSENRPCIDSAGSPCCWVDYNLCSSCADEPELPLVQTVPRTGPVYRKPAQVRQVA